MRRASLIIFILVLWLATCQAPQPKTPAPEIVPTQTVLPATDTAVPPTPTETAAPQPKLAAAPFDAQPYINEEAGFALDIPASWTTQESVVGSRGTEIQFLSSPDLANVATLPAGATRLTATIYQWDPKNDLDAYVANRKTAWEASGFTILEEQPLTLEQGLPAVQFTVESSDTQTVFLITALKDQYLVLAGEGDLDLVKQIVQRLRPIQ
jgi:hypothetical protein